MILGLKQFRDVKQELMVPAFSDGKFDGRHVASQAMVPRKRSEMGREGFSSYPDSTSS